MRRLVAALGILAFANVSLVRASGLCPLVGRDAHAPAVSAVAYHGDHANHGASVDSGTDAVNEAPVPEQDHPGCVMMGPCGLSLDVGRVITTASLPHHIDGIHAGSDRAPPSQTTSPDSPPPRV